LWGSVMKVVLATILVNLFLMPSCFSQDSDSLIYLEEVSKALKVMKKQPLEIDKALRKSVKHYEKSRDKVFLVKLIKNYKDIFEVSNQHYIVEMFFPLYKKDKKKFEKLLDEALSQKTKAEFLERMKVVAREENGGNG
jgi:hypothetical protein